MSATDAIQRVRDALAAAGQSIQIVEFAESTRTADDAARAVGTTVGSIVKSLVFVAGETPILVLVSGDHRLDVKKLAAFIGQKVRRASADEAQAASGFAIGGVPPLGHPQPLPVYVDDNLLGYDLVYAAAGTPHAVFAIAPADLVKATGGVVLDLAVQA